MWDEGEVCLSEQTFLPVISWQFKMDQLTPSTFPLPGTFPILCLLWFKVCQTQSWPLTSPILKLISQISRYLVLVIIPNNFFKLRPSQWREKNCPCHFSRYNLETLCRVMLRRKNVKVNLLTWCRVGRRAGVSCRGTVDPHGQHLNKREWRVDSQSLLSPVPVILLDRKSRRDIRTNFPWLFFTWNSWIV